MPILDFSPGQSKGGGGNPHLQRTFCVPGTMLGILWRLPHLFITTTLRVTHCSPYLQVRNPGPGLEHQACLAPSSLSPGTSWQNTVTKLGGRPSLEQCVQSMLWFAFVCPVMGPRCRKCSAEGETEAWRLTAFHPTSHSHRGAIWLQMGKLRPVTGRAQASPLRY